MRKEAGELQDIIRRHLVFILFVDNVQISALTKSLKINIEIAYLDGHSADGTVNFVSFQNLPETDVPNLRFFCIGTPERFPQRKCVLIKHNRPGHYDILEKRLNGGYQTKLSEMYPVLM